MDNKTKIALVDDDSFCLNYYNQVLKDIGFGEVYHFSGGDELLSKKEFCPDIIFLDYFIEGIYGIELINKLYKTYPDVRIVVLSGQKDMGTTINLMNCGVFDYIIKNENDTKKIMEVLEKYLAGKEFIDRLSGPNNKKGSSTCSKMIAEAQNKIRKEISEELHDNVNQLLGASKLYIETAKRDSDRRMDLLNESKNILETAIGEIRKISHKLQSVTQKGDSFTMHVASLLSFLKKQDKFIVSHNLKPELLERCLNPEQKHNLLRILQEMINNAIKYSEAANFTMTSKISQNHLELIIKDDGKGFDFKKKKKGIGLGNIYSRITSINGTVDLYTGIGKGCSWKINIPFQTYVA